MLSTRRLASGVKHKPWSLRWTLMQRSPRRGAARSASSKVPTTTTARPATTAPVSPSYSKRSTSGSHAAASCRRRGQRGGRAMKAEARRALTVVADDGTNEAMLERHGVTAALLDGLVATGHLRIEP